jgi:hypothetical protein
MALTITVIILELHWLTKEAHNTGHILQYRVLTAKLQNSQKTEFCGHSFLDKRESILSNVIKHSSYLSNIELKINLSILNTKNNPNNPKYFNLLSVKYLETFTTFL